MATRYKRNLGRVQCLQPGEWTDRTASGCPALRCGSCGTIFDLPDSHRIEDAGRVVPALRCADVTCSEYSYVTLEDFGEEILR
jgi:hypothetical protein